MTSKPVIYVVAAVVFGICLYVFLRGSNLLEGRFKDDPLAWYFLAKGIFCSVSLVLTRELLTAIREIKPRRETPHDETVQDHVHAGS